MRIECGEESSNDPGHTQLTNLKPLISNYTVLYAVGHIDGILIFTKLIILNIKYKCFALYKILEPAIKKSISVDDELSCNHLYTHILAFIHI